MDRDDVLELLQKTAKTKAEFTANLEMYEYGTPLEYILGYKILDSLKFNVDRRVYIPNEESLPIIDIASKFVPSNGCFVDVGTGCGWIAILLKKRFPHASAIATDIEKGAIEVARSNATRHAVEIHFERTCLLEGLGNNRKLDLIIADLPYGDYRHTLTQVTGSAHDHLPVTSTFPMGSVLSLYRKLIKETTALMCKTIICEIGLVDAEIVKSELNSVHFDLEIIRHGDFGFAVLSKKNNCS